MVAAGKKTTAKDEKVRMKKSWLATWSGFRYLKGLKTLHWKVPS